MRAPAIAESSRQIISLRFPAVDAAVRGALLQVDDALAAARVDGDLRHRTQIALAEACNNIVEHAYTREEAHSDQAITLDISADLGGLQIALRDRGGPMPDGRLPGPDLPPIDPGDPLNLPEGGFGWPLLRGMTRSLSLSRRNGQNILRFRLPLTEKGGPPGRNAM